jgi:two-component system sensor kinase FixL
MVQVSVADTGPGVPADEVEDIFESLYSSKEAGMGVGLATCRAIIEAHGGRIWCTPNPMGGAIFHFTVPAAEMGD